MSRLIKHTDARAGLGPDVSRNKPLRHKISPAGHQSDRDGMPKVAGSRFSNAANHKAMCSDDRKSAYSGVKSRK
jgi:hypothetical protein